MVAPIGGQPPFDDAAPAIDIGDHNMTTSATQFFTRVRTWGLVAALTGLVVALGALLGGTFLWLFAGLAVVFNLGGYFFSDKIALRVARAQPLSSQQAPAIHAAVRALAGRAGIPMPALYVMPGEQPNAFATGRDPQHAAIAATEGLLTSLPLEQVQGVLAHEIAHIKNRDILLSSVAAMIAGAVSAIGNILQLSFLFGGEDEDNPLGLLGSLAVMLLAPLGATLLQLGVSRQREYLADATAAELLGHAAPLADALESIASSRTPALEVNPVTAPMYIANPLAGAQLGTLFSTHPPMEERVRRLRAYDRAAARLPVTRHAAAGRAL
jgi:heat shock protein HtpX